MSRELAFYTNEAGDILEKLVCEGGDLSGLKAIEANSTDAAGEKHVPVIEVAGNKVTVKVGEVAHPMTEKHHIAFVILVTEKTIQRVDLDHEGEPVAEFVLADDDKAIAAYEYCNLHGLWIAQA